MIRTNILLEKYELLPKQAILLNKNINIFNLNKMTRILLRNISVCDII